MAQDPPGSLIIPPRAVATGTPAGEALENVNTSVLANGALCYVTGGVGRGEWQLQKESTTPPDGTSVVAPISGPGRWFFKMASGTIQTTPERKHWWVDPNEGSDSAAGDENTPFLTLDAAIRAARVWSGKSMIHILPLEDPDARISSEELFGTQLPEDLDIVGDGVIEVLSGLTLDNVLTAPNFTYTLSGASLGAAHQYSGMTLECVTSSIEGLAGQSRTIFHHTGQTMELGWHHDAYPTLTNTTVGDTFRIVRPAVRIAVNPNSVILGGRGAISNTGVPAPSRVGLRNLELGFPDGQSGFVDLVGSFDLFGVCCTDEFGTSVFNFWKGSMRAGCYITAGAAEAGSIYNLDGNGEYLHGWGLSTRRRGAGTKRPRVDWHETTGIVNYTCGQTYFFDVPLDFVVDSYFIDGRGLTGSACAYLQNSHPYYRHNASNGYQYSYLTDHEGVRDLLVRGGMGGSIPVGATHYHMGIGAFFRAIGGGSIYCSQVPRLGPDSSTPTIDGTSSRPTWLDAGMLWFEHTDGAWLGDIILGSTRSNGSITGCTDDAAPIVITLPDHGLTTGDRIHISGVLGNLAANGDAYVTVVDDDNFALHRVSGTRAAKVGDGDYTSGGILQRALVTRPAAPFRTGEFLQGPAGEVVGCYVVD